MNQNNPTLHYHIIHKQLLSGLIVILLLCSGCSNKHPDSITKSGFALDTFITITIYDSKNTDLLEQCFSLCDTYENLFSNTIDTSDISRINAANGSPVKVSADTIFILRKAIEYGDLSNGLFDITIAPVSSQWNFTSKEPVLPDKQKLQSALSHVSYKAIQINSEESTVTLNDKNTAIDLGGIAKGYIADKLKAYLDSQNVHSAIIDLGGNILTVGSKPDHTDFRIGIKQPFSDTQAITAVHMSDRSVVTSGTYQRCFTLDDKLYHHLLSPYTGYPVNTGLNSVTIISSSSIEGDALSTTCMLLGKDDGMALIESLPGVEAIFISDKNELYYSGGVEQYLLK